MKGTETQLPLPKRLLSVFFAVVLVVGLVPVTAWAEGDESQQSQNTQTGATQEQACQAQVPENVTGGGRNLR